MRIDRRAFLKGGGIALFATGIGPAFLTRTATAASPPGGRPKVLVTIFQRGAMDGLAAVAPTGQQSRLETLRPRLAMSAAKSAGDQALIDLDNGFALHPALRPLMPLWRDRDLAIVHGVGSPDPTRSHFDAQAFMETGTPGRRTAEGWLNRVVGRLGHEASPFGAVALGSSLPRALAGPAKALAIADLEALRVPEALTDTNAGPSPFETLFGEPAGGEGGHGGGPIGSEVLAAVRLLDRIGDDTGNAASDTAVRYPRGRLGASLSQIARLIKADVGLKVAFTSSGGWDTHVLQGTSAGSFARRATVLARSIAAFFEDLGPRRDDVVLSTMTEFGRTVAENGSGGTDHGHGSCLFVIGGGVDGGRVLGSVPTLDRDALHDGRDLPVTTDFRSVFSEVAHRHLGIGDAAAIFPGWSGPRCALWKGNEPAT